MRVLVRLGIETIQVDMELAGRAAAVRVRTGLELPDAYTVATAVHADRRRDDGVRIESFDKKVNQGFADLHPLT